MMSNESSDESSESTTLPGPAPERLTEHDYSPIIDELEALSRTGESRATVFRDFVDVALAVFTGDTDELTGLFQKYDDLASEPDANASEHFKSAFEALLLAYNEVNHDVIGAVYEQMGLENQHMGQYFTPDSLSRLMAAMLSPGGGESDEVGLSGETTLSDFAAADGGESAETDDSPTVHDPCCGSGRLLIDAALESGCDGEYTGVDKSELAAKLAVVNLAILNVDGRIQHGDSLKVEGYQGWTITPTPWGIGNVTHHSLTQ